MRSNLLAEMVTDFMEDMEMEYAQIAKEHNILAPLPTTYINDIVAKVTHAFNRLKSIRRGEFREVLFRTAVASVAATIPLIAIVNNRYIFNLALASVANQYKPKHNPPALVAVA